MEQYIRITKASKDNLWYNEHITKIYPVKVSPVDKDFWIVCGLSRSIFKSDCELVSITVNTMPEEKEPDAGTIMTEIVEGSYDLNQAAREYGKRRNDIPQFSKEDEEAFKAGAEWALQHQTIGSEKELLSKGDISGEWLEKAKREGYTISDEQLWQLNNEATQGHKQNIREMLKEWFPNAEVFQPKTYSVGLRLIDKKHPEISYKVIGCGDKITVLQENENRLCNRGWAIEVEDMEAITKEELNSFFGDISSFTLIEPSKED